MMTLREIISILVAYSNMVIRLHWRFPTDRPLLTMVSKDSESELEPPEPEARVWSCRNTLICARTGAGTAYYRTKIATDPISP